MKAVLFGELMLRLNPTAYGRFLQADEFKASYGGGEANVAVSLSQLGERAAFVSKLPDHEMGQAALNSLRRYGVDTSFISRGGSRLGIYYLEKGAAQRPSKVIYDRAGSSFAYSSMEDYRWDEILKGADWFHFTGITPALGGELPAICLEAVMAAKELNVTVSCDLNYRKKLWSRQEAGRIMRGLCKYVDVCIANEEDAGDMFGITSPRTEVSKGQINTEGYISVARALKDSFGFKKVAITLRESVSASDNNWSAMLYSGPKAYFSRSYPMRIVDRVGGGDAFAAGLIYALGNGFKPQEAVDFAAAAGCLKHSIEGDCNLVSAEEVRALAAGDGSGRVQR